MAANDVFKAEFHFEAPSGKASTGLYYREVTANAANEDVCKDICDAIHAAMGSQVLGILSDEWWFTAISCRMVHPTAVVTPLNGTSPDYNKAMVPPYIRTVDVPGQQGTWSPSGPALPANNTTQMDLNQTTSVSGPTGG